MKTTLGTCDGRNFSLDVNVLVDTRGLICASSGAGKSYLLRRLAELVADKIPTIILDPEGEFATLREKLDVLVVAENGDIKPDIKSAGLLARKLVETSISAVIDIYDLPGEGDPWDKRRLFVYAFLTGLMNIPKSLYHPMLICIDEAHNFAMENPSGEGKELTKKYFKISQSPSILARSAVRNLMSAGRKRGIGGVLATQRVSKIDKDSIADARNVFIGGTNLDIDQQRAGDMLGMPKKEAIVALRELVPGEFYYFGPAIEKRGVFRFKSSQVETTHPKAGQRNVMEVPKASTQVKNIMAHFEDLPQEVEAEVRQTTELQVEIARLKRELSARPVQMRPETKIERVEVPLLQDEKMSELASLILAMNTEAGSIQAVAKDLIVSAKHIGDSIEMYKKYNQRPLPSPVRVQPIKADEKIFAVHREKPITNNAYPDESVTGPEQRILDAIAWFESIGIFEPRQEAVAFLAGYTFGGGAFNNPRGRLNSRGFIIYRGKSVAMTELGRTYARGLNTPLTVDELQSHVSAVLPKSHQRILQALLSVYPESITKDDLSETIGKRGGAFNNPLGRLRSMGLIEYPDRGRVRAMPFLFLE